MNSHVYVLPSLVDLPPASRKSKTQDTWSKLPYVIPPISLPLPSPIRLPTSPRNHCTSPPPCLPPFKHAPTYTIPTQRSVDPHHIQTHHTPHFPSRLTRGRTRVARAGNPMCLGA
ncbi:hypothetical protein IQ07DRAFT_286294 [Pyrenochaeta sp. DS3sAY3a]|nr:hypothetical protein IQ07DRAFT_286294 [Pyrenochaeta sp. DS3sAY3a]